MSDLALRERIVLAMMAALTAGCAPIVPVRNRRSPVSDIEAPAIVLYDGGHQAEFINAGSVHYAMDVEIEGTVSGAEEQLGSAVNELYVRLLRSFPDPSLSGLCINVTEISLDLHIAAEAESARPLATFTLRLMVDFETNDGDPTA